MTPDGIAVGLQVGILPGRPRAVLITPVETVCKLYQVATAA